jgi:F0F1-type ATP synthase membrane subunit b/b'
MADPISGGDQTGLLAAAGVLLTTVVVGVGKWLTDRSAVASEKRRADERHDDESDLIDQLRDTLKEVRQQASEAVLTANKRIDELTQRVDAMAHERNQALVENASLKGEVKRLEGDVERLTRELAAARVEIDELKAATPRRRT